MRKLAPTVALALACTASHASTCDELRAQIEGKIKAAGVASFAVTVVDSAASAPGKVVGTCDKGAKKMVYVQGPSPSSATLAAKPTAKTPAAAILTECKDGSTSMGGNCKP